MRRAFYTAFIEAALTEVGNAQVRGTLRWKRSVSDEHFRIQVSIQVYLPCALRPNNLHTVYVDETFLYQKPSQLLESLEKEQR